MKRYLTSLVLICTAWVLVAQSTRCKPPKQALGVDKIGFLLEKGNSKLENRTGITIPVVVHILWNKEEENISDEQIYSQIDVLNQDFQTRNREVEGVPSNFKDVLANIELEFCLATTDPRGNATDGIERVFTSIPNIGSSAARIKYASRGGADAWNTKHYINFWIGKRNDGILGQATNPEELPEEEQGLIIDYRAFGTLGAALDNAPYHLGRTVTHELGHYFGLNHLWGSALSCTDDDGLDDTPLQSATYNNECPTTPVISCGNSDMYMNFMNYTNDACMAMFTKQQKGLMLATISEFRADLLVDNACTMMTSSSSLPEKSPLKLYPNPANSQVWFEFPQDISLSSTVFIYNSIGKLEQSLNLPSHKVCLDTQVLSAGVYIVVVPIGATQWTTRFIILK